MLLACPLGLLAALPMAVLYLWPIAFPRVEKPAELPRAKVVP